jgi:hypothetical protein
VDNDILGADRRETIAAMFADAFGETRAVWLEFEVGAVAVNQRRQRGDANEAVNLGDDRLVPHHLFAQNGGQVGGHVGVHFEQDHAPAPPPPDRGAEQAHQILGLFLDFNVAVADDAEGALRAYGEAREQNVAEHFDHRFDRHPLRLVTLCADKARQ